VSFVCCSNSPMSSLIHTAPVSLEVTELNHQWKTLSNSPKTELSRYDGMEP
jgi:hypothetical protein